MKYLIGARVRRWTFVVGCLLIVPCLFVVRSRRPPSSGAEAAKPIVTLPAANVIIERQESVGWVFGRVVGFEGADKPLLRRRTFPTPTRVPSQAVFRGPGSR